ncbi:amino acid adenylation domain-containing protein [Catenulispora subtropica]|uniref:Carrier domain-containing protein n=1 Tax=Catenulispora subtropica TaxID=450798 RepID=A0ABN2RNI5_9ACTN
MEQAPTGIPMSPAQQGLWFAERTGTAAAAYLVPAVVVVPEPMEQTAIDRAWTTLVRRHPLLAALVVETAGEPRLVRGEPVPVAHRTVGAAGLMAGLAEELAVGFDFAGAGRAVGPLARCVALRVDDGRTVMMIVGHHLVVDASGRDLVGTDLAAALAGRDLGAGSLTHIGELVQAQSDRIAQALPAARAFWAGRPAPPAEVLMPGLAATPTVAEPATHLDIEWNPRLDAAMTAGAAELGATRFEILLAGVHAVLARYGNTLTSVAVDVTTRRPETAGELGMWVNEVPVTMSVDLQTSFADLVRAVRAEARAAYAHREVPPARARTGLPPRLALAPVSTSYLRLDPSASGVDRLFATASVRAATHLHFIDTPHGLTGRMHVPTRLLARADAERFAAHLRTLIGAGLAEPDRAVGELDLLGAAERAALAALTGPALPRPSTTVLDQVRAAAERTPDAPAVSGVDGTLSYRELVAGAHRVGHGLRRRGVAAGDVVGLCAHRRTELVTGLLGILAAGAAYLPLDPAYPAERSAFIAADAGAKLVLGHEAAMTPLSGLSLELVPLDAGAAFAAEPATPPAATDPDGLAYVIYTSGSTGRPKGVEIGHAALVNLVAAMGELIGTGPADHWLNLTSVSFDISGLEIFAPLTAGGEVTVAADAAVREGTALARLIGDTGITHVQATPSSWQLLLDAGWDGAPVTALCGGEPLPLPLARRLRPLVGRLINVYGPTETTIWSTAAEVPPDPRRVTIGGPIANTTLHVLDAGMRPMPVGVPGELWIGGAGLARGYRGRPDLTAAGFVTDPSGRRLYRTGDRVRLGMDGDIEFLGRGDDQIKLRGHRIELGEIEQALLGAPGVTQAAVAVWSGELVAYVVGVNELAPVRAHIARVLPRFMIPRDFVRLERLPATPNGKLDRGALPAPAEDGADLDNGAAAPAATAAEPDPADLTRIVTDIWREVLREDRIKPDDSLFDLGGHSLTIMQITARILDAVGVEVPFDLFFDTPTIDGVVACVEELQQEDA